ncbi:hypothetical protein KP509_16G019100, partial [Ceratopteris richardii]
AIPLFPQPLPRGTPHPSNPTEYRGTTVPDYPVLEPTPEQIERRQPCCGIGLGWFLFIIGFFLASIPWYVGVVMLVCIKHDHKERIGLVCCTIAAILSLIVAVVGGTCA